MSDTNPPEQPVESSPNPLPYEAPRDRVEREPPANVLAAAFSVLFGAAISLAATFFVSMYLFVSLNPLAFGGPPSPPANHPADHVTGCIYILAFAAIGWVAFLYHRRVAQRSLGRWLSIGLLMGLGVGCLIEGVCFVAQ